MISKFIALQRNSPKAGNAGETPSSWTDNESIISAKISLRKQSKIRATPVWSFRVTFHLLTTKLFIGFDLSAIRAVISRSGRNQKKLPKHLRREGSHQHKRQGGQGRIIVSLSEGTHSRKQFICAVHVACIVWNTSPPWKELDTLLCLLAKRKWKGSLYGSIHEIQCTSNLWIVYCWNTRSFHAFLKIDISSFDLPPKWYARQKEAFYLYSSLLVIWIWESMTKCHHQQGYTVGGISCFCQNMWQFAPKHPKLCLIFETKQRRKFFFRKTHNNKEHTIIKMWSACLRRIKTQNGFVDPCSLLISGPA